MEALDPSFVCNVVVAKLSGPLRDLLSFLSRDGVCYVVVGELSGLIDAALAVRVRVGGVAWGSWEW